MKQRNLQFYNEQRGIYAVLHQTTQRDIYHLLMQVPVTFRHVVPPHPFPAYGHTTIMGGAWILHSIEVVGVNKKMRYHMDVPNFVLIV